MRPMSSRSPLRPSNPRSPRTPGVGASGSLRLFALVLALGLSAGAAAWAAPPPAQPRLEDSPGYVPIGELGIFSRQELTTEIHLDGAILKLVAEAARQEDPDFAKLISGLEAIRVQIAPLKGPDQERIRARIDEAARWLEARGWQVVVRVREKEESYIYLKEVGGQIVGLTVLSFEPGDEAALINIVGRLDPAEIGRLGRGLHLRQLERVPQRDDKH
jgi:hypothetical protein